MDDELIDTANDDHLYASDGGDGDDDDVPRAPPRRAARLGGWLLALWRGSTLLLLPTADVASDAAAGVSLALRLRSPCLTAEYRDARAAAAVRLAVGLLLAAALVGAANAALLALEVRDAVRHARAHSRRCAGLVSVVLS